MCNVDIIQLGNLYNMYLYNTFLNQRYVHIYQRFHSRFKIMFDLKKSDKLNCYYLDGTVLGIY